MDGILDRDRADALQPAPDLDAEIGRLGWQLVNEQQPARGLAFFALQRSSRAICIRSDKACNTCITQFFVRQSPHKLA